jgi:hypothetical protein
MLLPNICIIVNKKMIKLRKLFIFLSLFFYVLASCGVRKPYPCDRFGGGVNSGMLMRGEVDKVAESSIFEENKKQNKKFQSREIYGTAEVSIDSGISGKYWENLKSGNLIGVDKKVLMVLHNFSTGKNIAKLQKAIQEQPKGKGDKSKKWARILANSALILLLLGLVSLLLFSSESDFTGIALLVLFWLLALVAFVVALVLIIIGKSKSRGATAG